MNDHAFPYDTGVIHGRFQVLHNDHLKYLLAGKALCRHLVVGITNPDPFLSREEGAAPWRNRSAENPLTYYERQLMTTRVLLAAGLHWQEFTVVPLPINFPERYRYYVPLEAVFFLTIYDDWGRRKLKYFQSLSLATHVLWEVPIEEKGISAGDVRHRMRRGELWEHMVPAGVPPLMQEWRIVERLRGLSARD